MREYGKIKTGFWSNRKIRLLSDEAKLLFTYLVACPHGNSIGCFVLPLGYIVEDMNWSLSKVSATVRELLSNGLVDRHEDTRVVHISSWWEHNSIENPNVARSALLSWDRLPDCPQKAAAALDLLATTHRLDDHSVTVLERFIERFRNNEPEKETEEKTEKETEPPMRAAESPSLFEVWWSEFPRTRRGSKAAALKSWKRIVASDLASPEEIYAGLSAYLNSRDVAEGFACQAVVWLNNERWNDEPTQAGYKDASSSRNRHNVSEQAFAILDTFYDRLEQG